MSTGWDAIVIGRGKWAAIVGETVRDIDAVLDHAQTVVVSNKDPDFNEVLRRRREGKR